jgi:putative inorganic carbon (HCO3(-)) transporter
MALTKRSPRVRGDGKRRSMHLGIYHLEALLMYIGAILAFLLSIIWKPPIGLYYLVPLLPMQTARYWLHEYFLGEKLVDILLLGVLIGLFIRRERPIFIASRVNKLLIVLFALTYLSLWQGALYLGGALPISYLDPRFSDWKNYVEMMFLFFVVAATIRTPKQMKIILAIMCLSILQINRTYHDTVGDRDFSHFSYGLRDAGPLGYAGENGMGAFQAGMAVFLIGLTASTKRQIVRLGLWAVAGSCVYSLVLTFSRGGYLGFMAGLLILGIVKERKLLILFVVLLLSWQSLVPGAVTERVLMTYDDSQGLDASAGERVTLWRDAMQVIDHDPVIGTGFDTYKFMGRVGDFKDTHNYYVKVLVEMGVIGLLFLFYVLGVLCTMCWRLFHQAHDEFLGSIGYAVFALSICTIIVNFFGDRWTYLQVNGFFWVLLGLVARGLFILQQNEVAQEASATQSSLTSAITVDASHA